ncbi:MAG: DUF2634 domain-containing protein [Romboutsia timonensis]
MLPEQNSINQMDDKMPSYTYNINRNTNRISGYIDNKDAIIQSIYLILQTERYESMIYNWYYGVEFDNLVGKNRDYVTSELKRVIREALLEDDRITEVTSFSIEYKNDSALVEFLVQTIVGDITIEWEVNI